MKKSEGKSADCTAATDDELLRFHQCAVAADTRLRIDAAVAAISQNQDFVPVTSGVTDVGFLKELTKDLRNELKKYTLSGWYVQKISNAEKLTEEQYPIYRAARLAVLDAKLGRVLADGADLNNEMTGRDMAASYLLAAAGLYLSTYLTTMIGQRSAPRTAAREMLPELEAELINALRSYARHDGAASSHVAAALADSVRPFGTPRPAMVDQKQTGQEPGAVPDALADPARRLARLREFGGSANYQNGEWKFKEIKELVATEKSEKRKRSDEKTIRADLRLAAQAERETKAAGHFDGLHRS